MLQRGFIPATEPKPFSLCDSDLNFAVSVLNDSFVQGLTIFLYAGNDV